MRLRGSVGGSVGLGLGWRLLVGKWFGGVRLIGLRGRRICVLVVREKKGRGREEKRIEKEEKEGKEEDEMGGKGTGFFNFNKRLRS